MYNDDKTFPPIYMEEHSRAVELGEVDQFHESSRHNHACIRSIDEEISNNTVYGEMAGTRRVDTEKAMNAVMNEYGAERVCVVIAAYIKRNETDGRISRENKEWASNIETPQGDFNPILTAHQTVLDNFADKVRAWYETQEKAKEKSSQDYGVTLENQSTTSETAREINQNFKEVTSMESKEIIARVTPIENDTTLKGLATVTVGGVAIHGIGIRMGEKGLYLTMPSEKGGDGNYYDTVLPASKDAHAKLKDAVLKAHAEAIEHGKQEKIDNPQTETNIKVGFFRDNPYKNNILGDCQVTVNDVVVIKGIKVITTKEAGELSIAMPNRQDQFGEYISVATPCSKELFAQIKEAVLTGYKQHKNNIIGNTPYNELGGDLAYKTQNAEFTRTFLAEQLEAAGVRWSAKIDDKNATISVNKADEALLDSAIEKARETGKVAKEAGKSMTETATATAETVAPPPAPRRK